MPKPEVLSLVASLKGSSTIDDANIERAFQRVLIELAKGRIRTTAQVLDVTQESLDRSEEHLFKLPDELVDPLLCFFDARMIEEASTFEIEATKGTDWRDHHGLPVAYTKDQEDSRTYRLYPIPERKTRHPIIPLWSPLGANYPEDAVLVIASERRDQDPTMLYQLDLYIALRVLERVFGEDSPARDPEYSMLTGKIAAAMEAGLGFGEGA